MKHFDAPYLRPDRSIQTERVGFWQATQVFSKTGIMGRLQWEVTFACDSMTTIQDMGLQEGSGLV